MNVESTLLADWAIVSGSTKDNRKQMKQSFMWVITNETEFYVGNKQIK